MGEPAIDYSALARALLDAGLPQAIVRQRDLPEPLMTRAELAQHLRVTPAQVDRLAALGMPREYIGSDPRFDLTECRRWLREHQAPRARGANLDEPMPGVRRAARRRGRGA